MKPYIQSLYWQCGSKIFFLQDSSQSHIFYEIKIQWFFAEIFVVLKTIFKKYQINAELLNDSAKMLRFFDGKVFKICLQTMKPLVHWELCERMQLN